MKRSGWYNKPSLALCTFLFIAANTPVTGQISINNAPLAIQQNGILSVAGNVYFNDTARIVNHGMFELKGDWTNTSAQEALVFNPASTGRVVFSGGKQNIGGGVTRFPNVVMEGNGVKILDNNTEVASTLTVDRVELNLNGHIAHVMSPDIKAISSLNIGYVNSSTATGGWLAQEVAQGSEYEFPMGASENGLFRYRPIAVKPDKEGKLYVKFQYYDPYRDGYDPARLATGLGNVNPYYYHGLLMESKFGVPIGLDLRVPLHSISDGNFETLATWEKRDALGAWTALRSLAPTMSITPTTDILLSTAGPYMVNSGALAVIGLASKKSVKLKVPNVITPNGDGLNDQFRIEGLQLYSGGAEISIYNRWGSEVYRATNYDNKWSGEGLNAGTYYYVLKLRNGDTVEIQKGWIQILR